MRKHIGPADVRQTVELNVQLEHSSRSSATMTYTGAFENCAAYMAKLPTNGTIMLPSLHGLPSFPLRRTELRRKDGYIGELTLMGWVERFQGGGEEEEGEPLYTRVSVSTTPRNIPLEQGIVAKLGSGYFDLPLLEFWQQTQDFRRKRNFQALVPALFGVNATAADDPATQQNIDQVAEWQYVDLDETTKAIAQRILLGMSGYEAYYPVARIERLFRDAAVSYVKPGRIGNPVPSPPGDWDGYSWICSGLGITPNADNTHLVTNDFTGIPTEERPTINAPLKWGNLPFDGLYYTDRE